MPDTTWDASRLIIPGDTDPARTCDLTRGEFGHEEETYIPGLSVYDMEDLINRNDGENEHETHTFLEIADHIEENF